MSRLPDRWQTTCLSARRTQPGSRNSLRSLTHSPWARLPGWARGSSPSCKMIVENSGRSSLLSKIASGGVGSPPAADVAAAAPGLAASAVPETFLSPADLQPTASTCNPTVSDKTRAAECSKHEKGWIVRLTGVTGLGASVRKVRRGQGGVGSKHPATCTDSGSAGRFQQNASRRPSRGSVARVSRGEGSANSCSRTCRTRKWKGCSSSRREAARP